MTVYAVPPDTENIARCSLCTYGTKVALQIKASPGNVFCVRQERPYQVRWDDHCPEYSRRTPKRMRTPEGAMKYKHPKTKYDPANKSITDFGMLRKAKRWL